MQVTLDHIDGMAFRATSERQAFTLDAHVEHGGSDTGVSPKQALLASLAGCTAMDVVSILKKMRQSWTRLSVRAEGELTETHPKVFRDFTVRFEVEGAVDPAKLWRAIALSRDQYCGVSAMLRAHAPITVHVTLNGEDLPERGV